MMLPTITGTRPNLSASQPEERPPTTWPRYPIEIIAPISDGGMCQSGTSTGSTKAMVNASNASEKFVLPTIRRILLCHGDSGSRSMRAAIRYRSVASMIIPPLRRIHRCSPDKGATRWWAKSRIQTSRSPGECVRLLRKPRDDLDMRRVTELIDRRHRREPIAAIEQKAHVAGERRWIARYSDNDR